MADGDPLRAKELFEELDAEWFNRWVVWKKETNEASKSKTKMGK